MKSDSFVETVRRRASSAPPPPPRAPSRRKAEPEQLVVVRRSGIQGRGVFALVDIKRGTRIMEYVGERISHAVASERYDDESMRRHHTFLFAVSARTVIDGGRAGNDARYINHSCDPNCEAIIDRGRVFIDARRFIPAGAELTYDYWYTTDDSYTVEDLKRLYPCRCGTAKCRGYLARPPKKPKKKTAARKKS